MAACAGIVLESRECLKLSSSPAPTEQRVYPRQTAEHKSGKLGLLETAFLTRSWKHLEGLRSEELREGLQIIRDLIGDLMEEEAKLEGGAVCAVCDSSIPAERHHDWGVSTRRSGDVLGRNGDLGLHHWQRFYREHMVLLGTTGAGHCRTHVVEMGRSRVGTTGRTSTPRRAGVLHGVGFRSEQWHSTPVSWDGGEGVEASGAGRMGPTLWASAIHKKMPGIVSLAADGGG